MRRRLFAFLAGELDTALFLCGAGLLVAGVWWYSMGLALIVGGVVLMTLAAWPHVRVRMTR